MLAWIWIASAVSAVLTLVVAGLLVVLLWRRAADYLADASIERLMTEKYAKNLWELAAGFGHNPIGSTMENALRSSQGKVLHRPIGTARRFPHVTGLLFNPAQLRRPALEPDESVDTSVVLGPASKRPVSLKIPLLLGAMGFGLGVSDRVAVAMAAGAARAGTASNTGEGPLLPEVRQTAQHLILQFTGTPWTADPQVLCQADMVEIRMGQGAWASLGSQLKPEQLEAKTRHFMGVSEHRDVIMPSGCGGPCTTRELKRLVHWLRSVTGGVPIGIKLAATFDIEEDLDTVLDAGVDVVAIDGAQGGSYSAPAILADDFGLPTLHALVRAERHLNRRGDRDRVSLLIGGGLHTPGDYLKCLALGADAVYLGTGALFAVTHTQNARVLPWEPPTQLVGPMGKFAGQFDVESGAESLARFLNASAAEMAVGARALGKRSLRAISRADLFAVDPVVAAITGLPAAHEPLRQRKEASQ